MRILFRHLIVVVLLAGAARAQATPPDPWNPPIAGQWVDGTWSRFHKILCNQVWVRADDLAAAYADMDAAMGKNPRWCESKARDFAIAGGALKSLGIMAMQFEASSTSLNPVDAERIKFHDIRWSHDVAVHEAANIDCKASTAEAHALFDARFAELRKSLGDMPAVCGVNVDNLIARRRKEANRHDENTAAGSASAAAPATTPQTVNVTIGCSQAGTLPSLLALGVVLRRRRRSSR